ncbi:stage II sporulation protein D [Hydrogenoanaerobacterium sp.]|uniref:stage II sporulation protein D n=1 Tax=Hydrogenoanaerobacterium sp. TaxID=2953763 RepID=UPI0028A28669|nr:stage II sporulation protein D [Hydrogenoanaerobacterium sp.]
MKIPLMLFSVFAVLTLCLPLVAVGSSLPVPAPAQSTVQASQQPAQAVSQAEVNKVPQQDTPELQTIEAADTFRILNRSTGKVQKVKRIDYVRGAVCAEMPPSFHTQSLAAQAVAANTYAVRCQIEQKKNADPGLKGADFSADPDNWEGYVTEAQAKERFGDKFDIYWDKICKAADLGSSYVMAYEDEPIVAAYHAISTGQTEYAGNVWQGSAPYLVPVESFGDTLAPNYESTAEFTAQEVQEKLLAEDSGIQLGKDKNTWLRVVSRSESGYVLSVMAGNKQLAGKDIRRVFGLRSADFDLASNGNTFTFTIRGYGHGVGLSQYGADYMARQGSTFDEILNHYYTGCELKMVA